jgi:hypothetical protein
MTFEVLRFVGINGNVFWMCTFVLRQACLPPPSGYKNLFIFQKTLALTCVFGFKHSPAIRCVLSAAEYCAT